MERDNDRYVIQSVRQAGEVLKCIAENNTPISTAEIAKELNINVNAAFRQCITLESLGWIREVGEHWVLGMGLALFWARVRSRLEACKDAAQRDIDRLMGVKEEDDAQG